MLKLPPPHAANVNDLIHRASVGLVVREKRWRFGPNVSKRSQPAFHFNQALQQRPRADADERCGEWPMGRAARSDSPCLVESFTVATIKDHQLMTEHQTQFPDLPPYTYVPGHAAHPVSDPEGHMRDVQFARYIGPRVIICFGGSVCSKMASTGKLTKHGSICGWNLVAQPKKL